TSAPSPDRRRGWLVGAALIVLLLAAAAVLRGPLGDGLWPQARVHALSAQAADALARGHLTAVDGSGARELYEAARAIDPDQPAPRAGLARVAEAALAQAADAVAQERFAEAHSLLQLARELSIPRERADALAERLRTREAALAGVDGLAARAAEALAAGRLHGDEDAALALYARVLELAPDHAEALRGRHDGLAARLRRREAALAGVDGLAVRAGEAVAAGRLHGDEDAALALYARVLELAPDHAEALRGRDDALAALLEQARADLRGGELQAAA